MYQVKPEDFKIRCSAIGQICGGTIGLTDAQNREYDELSNKPKLTIKQAEKLAALEIKKTNIELPQTAKTYCETWLREKLYGRRKQIFTKQMEKGIICEDQSIEYIAKVMGLGMVFKNEERKTNDFMTGESDLVLPDEVYDIKNSFDFMTFPLFSSDIDKGYWLQLQGYMYLYNKPKAKLVYTLMTLPEDLMLAEVFWGEKYGIEEDEIRDLHTYNHAELGSKLTIKSFSFDYDSTVIDLIKYRVELCRIYIAGLLESIK